MDIRCWGNTVADSRNDAFRTREGVEELFGTDVSTFEEPYDWVTAPHLDSKAVETLPNEVRSRVILYAFLNQASRATDLSSAGLDLLDLFPEFLRGYSQLFEYEALKTYGSQQAADTLRDSIEAAYPELEWRLKAIDEGHGHIARAKEYQEKYQMIERINQGKVQMTFEDGSSIIVDSNDPRLNAEPDRSVEQENEEQQGMEPEEQDFDDHQPVVAQQTAPTGTRPWLWAWILAGLLAFAGGYWKLRHR